MKEKYRYLSKNLGLFALSGFIPKVLSFLLVPLYTGVLSTAEYGVSDLIVTTVALLVPLFTLDIQDAALRFALDGNYGKKAVFTVGLKTVCIGTLLVSLGAMAVSFLSVPGVTDEYLFFIAVMFFAAAGSNAMSLFCRGIDEVRAIAVSSIANSAIMLACNILFLAVFKWGLAGYLVANTIGSLVAMVYLFFSAKLYRFVGWKTDRAVLSAMLRYSFPLIFNVVAWWVNNASDRYILTLLVGVGTSGLYAVAYKIPGILSMFGNVFSQAWSVSAIKEFDAQDKDGFFGGTFSLLSFAMVVLCSAIMIASIPLARLIYAKEFFEAWMFVPPLLFAVALDVMCQFAGSIFTAVKDTKAISCTTVGGAVVNIALTLILVPFISAYGAALATMVGYGCVLVARLTVLRRHIRMKVAWRRVIGSYALLLVQLALASFGIQSIPLQMLVLISIVLLNRRDALFALRRVRFRKKRGDVE